MVKKDEPKQLEEKLINLENQLKRAVADYQNLEKRIQNDALALVDHARIELISQILPVLDSLDQAVSGASETEAQSSWLKGVLMAIKELRQILAEEGLVEIPAQDKFDPRFHEAVDVAEGEEGQIVKLVLRGYTLNERVVRPAKVVVGKEKPAKMSTEALKEEQTEES